MCDISLIKLRKKNQLGDDHLTFGKGGFYLCKNVFKPKKQAIW